MPLSLLHPIDWSTVADHVLLSEAFWLKLLRVFGILIGGYVVTRIILALIENYRRLNFSHADDTLPDAGAKRIDTISAILRHVTVVVFILATGFILLSELGINIAPLLAGAGIAGIAVGFGAQSLVKDLFYGFFILLENQFGIGDVIQIGDATGQVEQMSLRTVMLRDLDGRVHIIPNGDVQKAIVYTKDWSRMNLNLDVAYQTDLNHAFTLIEAFNQRFYQQHHPMILEPPQLLGVEALGENGVTLKIIAKTVPQKQWEISRAYRKEIKTLFDEAGIAFPFPQRTIHLASPPLAIAENGGASPPGI